MILRVFHASQVLDRARNTNRDIQAQGDNLAGLAHLPVVRGIAGIDCRAGCADGRPQLVSQLFDQCKVFFGANTAATETTTPPKSVPGDRSRDLVFNP